MKYVFKFKRWFFWKKIKVSGHMHVPEQDKMVIFFEDGGIREIKQWKKCEISLGVDWVLAQKKMKEKEIGQPIVLATE